MALLQYAMPTIFLQEGKFSNDPGDPGGPTNYGISLRFLKDADLEFADINHDGHIDIEDIKAMNVGDATKLYDIYFWSRYKYGLIDNQELATRLMSICINAGPMVAHQAVQRAIMSVNHNLVIIDDGVLGPKTITAINSCNRDAIIAAYKSEVSNFYRGLVQMKPQFAKYLKGWLNRVNSPIKT